MPRPRKCRRICREPEYVLFRPDGIAVRESVILTMDEFETIRLVDQEKKIPVMQAITRGAGLSTEGHGIVFSLPVSDVMGVARMMEEQPEANEA